MDWLNELIHSFVLLVRSNQIPDLGYWNYVLLALFVAIEGPIATLIGAAAASAGILQPALVFVAASTGNLTADSLWYYLGYVGNVQRILHYGRFLGVRPRHLERLTQAMHDHAPRILFLAKISSAFIIPSLIAAGLARVPWRRWFPVVFSGEMVWTGILVLAGYYATEAIKKIEKGIEYVALAGSILFIIFLVEFVLRRLLRKSKSLEEIASIPQDDDQQGEG